MEFNTDVSDLKQNLIIAIKSSMDFINENRQHIQPTKLAEVLEQMSVLEDKARKLFKEDDEFNPILKRFEKEIAKQREYIEKINKRVELQKEKVNDPEIDESVGVVIDDV